MTPDDPKSLKLEAVAYAADILEGLEETSGEPSIAAQLEDLTDEFDTARREGRGMNPYTVRSTVQALIDVVRFPPGNTPEVHSPDQGVSRVPFETPLFRYEPVRHRPFHVDGSTRTVFTVAAVAARFDLSPYENEERSPNTKKSHILSAIMIVAKANQWLSKTHQDLRVRPKTYNGVRKSYEKGLKLGYPEQEGALRGKFDKERAS